ncbi:MAG: hypothetical protein LBF68_01275 [Christensenellaceae bacterium]|jgi:hypothetical protein|nr:hypothetical protein [Christensenellaceae bacterium]
MGLFPNNPRKELNNIKYWTKKAVVIEKDPPPFMRDVIAPNWHICTERDYTRGFTYARCQGDYYKFSIDRCFEFYLNKTDAQEFYFDQTGKDLSDTDFSTTILEEQMTEYSGVIFTLYNDEEAILINAKIDAARELTTYNRPVKHLTEYVLKRHRKYTELKVLSYSSFPVLSRFIVTGFPRKKPVNLFDSNSCGLDQTYDEVYTIKEHNVAVETSNERRMVVCCKREKLLASVWDAFIRDMLNIAQYRLQKEALFFKDGFPKNLTINKYVTLIPKLQMK